MIIAMDMAFIPCEMAKHEKRHAIAAPSVIDMWQFSLVKVFRV